MTTLRITGTVDMIHYGEPKKTKLDLTLDLSEEAAVQLVHWRGQKLNFELTLASPFGPLFDNAVVQEVERVIEVMSVGHYTVGHYTIDGLTYSIFEGRQAMLGDELRQVAGLPEDAALYLVYEDAEGEHRQEIGGVERVDLLDQARFVSESVTAEQPEADDAEIADQVAAARLLVLPNGRGRGAE